MAPNDGHVVLEDVRIVFKNFAGKEGKFNREGDRNFAVLLDDDVARDMLADGWNIKWLKPREEGEPEQAYLGVSVNFRGPRPPLVVLITSRGRTNLSENECELLDWADIAMVDMIVRPYSWAVNGASGIKAYLKSIFVTIREDELELKYSNVPEIGSGEPLAIEGASRQYDYEGEIVED